MARSLQVVGILIALCGAFLVVMPFISVSRVGAEMLAELPEPIGADIVDQRVGWKAMFSDEFVVARRSYSGVTKQAVIEAYRTGSFDNHGVDGFSRECCGDYDAVMISITLSESGTVLAELSPADADVQLAWPVFAFLGSVVTIAGLALARVGHFRVRRGDDSAPSAQPDTA